MRLRFFLAVLSLNACVAGSGALTDAERREVAAAVDSATRAFEAAQRALDAERAVGHLGPEFYMYNDGVRADRGVVAERIRGTFEALQHLEPGFANLEVIVLGRDAAVVSFTFRDSITTLAGGTSLFRGATTLVWERRGTDWLITYADADAYADTVP